MKTLQEIKDEVAKAHGYENWYDTYAEPVGFEERENMINSVASKCCERQKEICTKESNHYHLDKCNSYNPFIILNAKLATDE